MTVQTVFARSEIKYLVTREQRERITEAVSSFMKPDEFGKSVICSLYYDTPDWLLIRRSLDAPVYKEKLRLRSYGAAKPGGAVYAEIKKKYDGVVYKRRLAMTLEESTDLRAKAAAGDGITSRELSFFLSRYSALRPAMFISSEREAFYDINDHEFRMTFDENVCARMTDLSLEQGAGGDVILGGDHMLMELKAGGAVPLYMARVLSAEGLFRASFSKYGEAYRRLVLSPAGLPDRIHS